MKPYPLLWAAVVAAFFAAQSLTAEVLEKSKDIAGTTVHYKVILPPNYDPARAYPTTPEIQGHLQEIYGVEVSPSLISEVTDAVLERSESLAEPAAGASVPDPVSGRARCGMRVRWRTGRCMWPSGSTWRAARTC